MSIAKRIKAVLLLIFVSMLVSLNLTAQVIDETQTVREKQSSMPKAINFYQLLDENKITREEFELWKRRRLMKLQERLTQMEALEVQVNPDAYHVGPGDVFYFNIWGAQEQRLPVTVSPEGTVYILSVGELNVGGKTLSEMKVFVNNEAKKAYQNCRTSISLAAVRFCRVHVVGAVQFPDTYVALSVDRISELITEAGGVTERAWKGGIEIRHADGSKQIFDLAAFERDGSLKDNIFVNGGDVIYIPLIGFSDDLIKIEADQEFSGTYKLVQGEKLLPFLQRIKALRRNTDLSKLLVIRSRSDKSDQRIFPFSSANVAEEGFLLQPGDRIVLPSQYVYVKGAVRQPGAYPYVFNLTAKEYAGMAGGDYRSASITSVSVYHARTRQTEKGPDVLVEPGDTVHLNLAWHQRFGNYLRILSTLVSLVLAAKAAGLFDKN